MSQVKLTKNELKEQKDALKMYTRYLPTLVLKKQQLQMEIRRLEEQMADVNAKKKQLQNSLNQWIAVFGEDVGLDESWFAIEEVKIASGNIAGVEIPVFEDVSFVPVSYDIWLMPPWVDKAIVELHRILKLDIELQIMKKQRDLLAAELRTTTQRVNLFEKIKIPETRLSIKKIGIYLGDQQTSAVVRGKISKRSLERVASW